MSARGLLLIGLGLGCFAAAGLCRNPQPTAPARWLRGIARPVLMPYLLQGLLRSQREGSVEEAALRGRSLMRLLPGWTDGHVLIAGFMGQAADSRTHGTDEALLRLHAALALLREAMDQPGSSRGRLFEAMAQELILRVTLDPALAVAWQTSTGENPYRQATDWLRQVPGYERDPQQRANLGFCLIDGLPVELRLGEDPRRALQMIDTARALLVHLEDRELAALWDTSLRKTRSFLDRSDDISLDELAADPRLEKITEALRGRRH